jgi:hypothetical protein
VRVGSKVVTVCGRVIANVYPNLARQSQQPALIHGIAYPGRLTILAGAPKSGKTAALLALGAAATRGRAPGGTGATCTVLIVQLEETAHETVQKFSAAGGDHKRAIIVPRLGDDRMASLAAEIEVHRPDIMVIDSLSRLNRMVSESSPERITQALEPLQDMARRFQCAVILIHHANKAGTVRGSTAIAAVADIVATISGNHDECMTIIESRGRVAPATLTLRAVDSSRTKFECFLDGDAREAAAVGAREALKDRILGALAAGPLGSADLRALVGGNGVECDRAALELAGANLINRLGPKKPWALVTTQAAAAPLRPAKRRRSVPRPEPRLRRAKSRRE